jgi:hypothetical protein
VCPAGPSLLWKHCLPLAFLTPCPLLLFLPHQVLPHCWWQMSWDAESSLGCFLSTFGLLLMHLSVKALNSIRMRHMGWGVWSQYCPYFWHLNETLDLNIHFPSWHSHSCVSFPTKYPQPELLIYYPTSFVISSSSLLHQHLCSFSSQRSKTFFSSLGFHLQATEKPSQCTWPLHLSSSPCQHLTYFEVSFSWVTESASWLTPIPTLSNYHPIWGGGSPNAEPRFHLLQCKTSQWPPTTFGPKPQLYHQVHKISTHWGTDSLSLAS